MSCDYPHCDGGQNGTACREQCKQVWQACHGPCQQGRLPCPTPEACVKSEEDPTVSSLVLGIVLVLTVLLVVWVLA